MMRALLDEGIEKKLASRLDPMVARVQELENNITELRHSLLEISAQRSPARTPHYQIGTPRSANEGQSTGPATVFQFGSPVFGSALPSPVGGGRAHSPFGSPNSRPQQLFGSPAPPEPPSTPQRLEPEVFGDENWDREIDPSAAIGVVLKRLVAD